MEIALQETRVIDGSDVASVWISISWSTMDAHSVARGEALGVIAKKEECRSFASDTLSPQDFANRARIKGIQEGRALGTISFTVGPAAKAIKTREKWGFAQSFNETGTELIAARKPRVAISFFDRAVELDPNYSEAYYFRGSAYAALSKRDMAQRELKKTLEVGQEDAVRHYVSAGLAALKKNADEACRFLKMAISDGLEDGTDIRSQDISILGKNDAIFDSVRNAPCYGEIVRGEYDQ